MTSPTVDLKVTNATVVNANNSFKGGVAADDGKIVAVGSETHLPDAEREIDAEGNFLLPGFIDPHVHLGINAASDDYKEQFKSDFETETRGAVHGGVTSFISFLSYSEQEYLPDLDYYVKAGEENSFIDFSFHANINKPHHVDEVWGLHDEGIRSYKLRYVWYKYVAPELGIDESYEDRVYHVMKQVAQMNHGVTMFHAENADLAKIRREEIQEEGRNDLEAWKESSPNIGESMMVENIGHLTEFTDSNSYVVHMSAGESVDVAKRFQDRGVQLHAETLPAFLAHTYEDDMGVWGKISPPVRGARTKKRLWEGLRNGVIDYIGTDHCPHDRDAKEKGEGKYGDVWNAIPGDNNGMEYMLPVMMSEGVNQNRISMERVVEVCSTNNAKMWGMYPRKGILAEGADADMVIVDLDKSDTVDDDFFHTMEPRYSSFHGWELTGLPTHTIVDGEVVVEDDQLVAEPGDSEFMPRLDSGVPSE
ncbi:dihydroorotase [Natrarchaeobius chitinivorans]|uniref:Dihydroorotase n=1 Tax=Natrarchaeobius chitinivorans TaxID=1679083 RepID=A0A3N6ME00_NATCH|nr:amidohydrolase family protein [Natrarchaeobius chitinivorans]RQG94850.1 dihydroorotase [Natrarchaeobius chitinivorans]